MKRLIFIIVFSIVSFNLYGQSVSKFRATHYCYQNKSNYTDTWLEFSDWESVSILIVIDYTKLRIVIYSDTREEFDITELYDTKVDSGGDTTTEFRAVDKNGVYCGVRFVNKISFDEFHLYIDYSNIRYAYNIESLD